MRCMAGRHYSADEQIRLLALMSTSPQGRPGSAWTVAPMIRSHIRAIDDSGDSKYELSALYYLTTLFDVSRCTSLDVAYCH